MTYTDKYGEFFGRRDEQGNVAILHVDDGLPATRLDASVYPILYTSDGDDLPVRQHVSGISARYEHTVGIVLHPDDAARLGIEVEQ